MKTFDIITLFPDLFTNHFNNLPFRRAVEKKLAEYKIWNLRNYGLDNYQTVDDKPYGGGTGMILMIEPIYNVLLDIYKFRENKTIVHSLKNISDQTNELKQNLEKQKSKIILLSPKGKKFNHRIAEELLQPDQLTFICGRYEGVDNRVAENIVTDVISIGDFVTSGGELPALLILETVTRLIPALLEKPDAITNESFVNDKLEHPQYTRPENFKGIKVPEILLSGDHKKIERWKEENSSKISI